jgi:hypothetical protein
MVVATSNVHTLWTSIPFIHLVRRSKCHVCAWYMLLKNNLMLASIVDWHCLDGMGKYLTKVNDLLLPFAPTNICP